VDTVNGGGSEVGNQLGRKMSKKIVLDQNLTQQRPNHKKMWLLTRIQDLDGYAWLLR